MKGSWTFHSKPFRNWWLLSNEVEQIRTNTILQQTSYATELKNRKILYKDLENLPRVLSLLLRRSLPQTRIIVSQPVALAGYVQQQLMSQIASKITRQVGGNFYQKTTKSSENSYSEEITAITRNFSPVQLFGIKIRYDVIENNDKNRPLIWTSLGVSRQWKNIQQFFNKVLPLKFQNKHNKDTLLIQLL